MSGVNEARCLVQYDLCEQICRSRENVCNSKQKWNHNELAVNVKNYMIKILLKVIVYVILGRVIVNIRKHAKLMNV